MLETRKACTTNVLTLPYFPRSSFCAAMEGACGCGRSRMLQIINDRQQETRKLLLTRVTGACLSIICVKTQQGRLQCGARQLSSHGFPCYDENQSLWDYRLPDSFKSHLGCHALDCCREAAGQSTSFRWGDWQILSSLRRQILYLSRSK